MLFDIKKENKYVEYDYDFKGMFMTDCKHLQILVIDYLAGNKDTCV